MNPNQSILIIVENLTVPLDRRVWQEATDLRDAGYTVPVICPKGGQYQAAYELLDGVHIFRHPMPIEADGALGLTTDQVADGGGDSALIEIDLDRHRGIVRGTWGGALR